VGKAFKWSKTLKSKDFTTTCRGPKRGGKHGKRGERPKGSGKKCRGGKRNPDSEEHRFFHRPMELASEGWGGRTSGVRPKRKLALGQVERRGRKVILKKPTRNDNVGKGEKTARGQQGGAAIYGAQNKGGGDSRIAGQRMGA